MIGNEGVEYFHCFCSLALINFIVDICGCGLEMFGVTLRWEFSDGDPGPETWIQASWNASLAVA